MRLGRTFRSRPTRWEAGDDREPIITARFDPSSRRLRRGDQSTSSRPSSSKFQKLSKSPDLAFFQTWVIAWVPMAKPPPNRSVGDEPVGVLSLGSLCRPFLEPQDRNDHLVGERPETGPVKSDRRRGRYRLPLPLRAAP